jgi:hypothetical protein
MPTTWPPHLKPANSDLSFEEAGIQEQTGEELGAQWITADGRVWPLPQGMDHHTFADAYLGGEDQAYSSGSVHVHFDDGILAIQARDPAAFNLAPLEIMANNPAVVGIVAESYPPGKYSSFSVHAFKRSYETLQDYIAQSWSRSAYGRLHYRYAAVDRSKVIVEPLTVDHLTITFNDKLFDYYLAAPNMEPGWYITEIGGMKVGFGAKYQLKKFMLKLKEEFFSDGQIPGSNIKIAPIPEISEPVVRRMGSTNDLGLNMITMCCYCYPYHTMKVEGNVDPGLLATVEEESAAACNITSETQKALAAAGVHLSHGKCAAACARPDVEENAIIDKINNIKDLARKGSVPIIEHGIPIEVKRKLEQGSVGPQVWEISEGELDSNKTLNSRPTGPML